VGTIKRWVGSEPPRLEDGDGKESSCPKTRAKSKRLRWRAVPSFVSENKSQIQAYFGYRTGILF